MTVLKVRTDLIKFTRSMLRVNGRTRYRDELFWKHTKTDTARRNQNKDFLPSLRLMIKLFIINYTIILIPKYLLKRLDYEIRQ